MPFSMMDFAIWSAITCVELMSYFWKNFEGNDHHMLAFCSRRSEPRAFLRYDIGTCCYQFVHVWRLSNYSSSREFLESQFFLVSFYLSMGKIFLNLVFHDHTDLWSAHVKIRVVFRVFVFLFLNINFTLNSTTDGRTFIGCNMYPKCFNSAQCSLSLSCSAYYGEAEIFTWAHSV